MYAEPQISVSVVIRDRAAAEWWLLHWANLSEDAASIAAALVLEDVA